jgi:fatty acid desaturase
MVPSAERLGSARDTPLVRADGRPTQDFRFELRRIPNLRNAVSVVSTYAQTIGILGVALWWSHPVGYVVAFFLMGRAHAQFASLMHEAAHRLLFSKRSVNDTVGRWLLGFPGFVSTDAYRRVHMAHHREEFGPEEPDIPLYRGYPIAPDSFRRKIIRDATGRTGLKLLAAQLRGARSKDPRVRHTLYKILGVQALLCVAAIMSGHWWVYPALWLAPFLTVWRVINRLRSIAEHGGMTRSKDRRETTHSVRQSPIAGFWLVPFNIGYHLAHHVDSGVPLRNLPRYHRALAEAGYVHDGYEHPSYRALWKALRSGHDRIA